MPETWNFSFSSRLVTYFHWLTLIYYFPYLSCFWTLMQGGRKEFIHFCFVFLRLSVHKYQVLDIIAALLFNARVSSSLRVWPQEAPDHHVAAAAADLAKWGAKKKRKCKRKEKTFIQFLHHRCSIYRIQAGSFSCSPFAKRRQPTPNMESASQRQEALLREIFGGSAFPHMPHNHHLAAKNKKRKACSISLSTQSVFKSSERVPPASPHRAPSTHQTFFAPQLYRTTLSKANLIKGLAAPPAAFQARLL